MDKERDTQLQVMHDENVRLDCLRMATGQFDYSGQALLAAKEYEKFVKTGEVEIDETEEEDGE